MTNPNCPQCHGTRRVKSQAKMFLGGVLQNVITYETECPRCLGAERFLHGYCKSDPMRP